MPAQKVRLSNMEQNGSSGWPRRFSEKEIQAILARAGELQRRRSNRGDESADDSSEGGISLEELQSVAREVGIDPGLVRQAGVELEHRPSRSGLATFLGEQPTQEERRRLEGKLSEDDLEELPATLDSVMGEAGQGRVSRSTLSWPTDPITAMRNGFQTRLRVRSTRKGTEITLRNELGNMAGGLFGGLMGGVGLGAGLGVGLGVGLENAYSAAFIVLVPLGFPAGSYILARGIFTTIARARRHRLRHIADELIDSAESLLAEPDANEDDA
ncbi:MAG: hypothetical protein ACOCYG_02480 [Spirochaetota bacterium]